MIRPVRGRGGAIVLAAILATTALGAGPPAADAAAPPVTLVAATTYDVLPDEHRVAVTARITATSTLKDTVTRRFYSDRAYLAVTESASNLRLAAATGKPSVSISSRSAGSAVLLLRFGSQLAAGKTLDLTLTFDIVDPGGAPDRPLRISSSLVLFSAWGIGTDGVAGSSVQVRLPGGYAASISGGPMTGPQTEADGHLVYASGPLTTPGTFAADIAADRPGGLVGGRRSVSVGARTVFLDIRAWPDDADWRARVSDILLAGLPALGDAVGIEWRIGPTLEVRETIPPAQDAAGGTEGAGAFDPVTGRLDVPYTADPTLILHGAAHAWFNATLVGDRWIAEGFADLAAAKAAARLRIPVRSPAMTLRAVDHATPLNAWVVGSTEDDFGYAAALQLARNIEARAGSEVLRAVWADAAAGIGPYQPLDPVTAGAVGSPETGAGPVDWRSLLDLLEEHSGRSFDGLWRQWVLRPSDAALLDVRAQAQALYAATVTAAAPWVLPRSVRDAMRAWQFDAAMSELHDLMSVIDQRESIARAAAAAGLQPPAALRRAFEGTAGVAAAAAEAVTEQAVIDAFDGVVANEPRNPGALAQIGMLGADPAAEIAAARMAFAAGDLDAAISHARSAQAVWADAAELGGRRVISAATMAFAIVVLLWLLVRRRRTPQPRIVRHAHRQPD